MSEHNTSSGDGAEPHDVIWEQVVFLSKDPSNQEAWKKLIGNIKDKYVNYCKYGLNLSYEDAEDVVQQACFKLFAAFARASIADDSNTDDSNTDDSNTDDPVADDLFTDTKKFNSWCNATVLNAAIDLIRRRNAKKRGGDLPHESLGEFDPSAEMTLPQKYLIVTEEAQLIAECVAKLPGLEQELIILHYYEDRGYKQIAKYVGRSRGSIGPILIRARNRLKTCLEQYPGLGR